MFNTILVPTDGSDHATKAVAIASDLAAQYGARMILLYAIEGKRVPEALTRFAEIEHLDTSGPVPRATTTPEPLYGSIPVTDVMPKEPHGLPLMEEVARRFLHAAEGIARDRNVENVTAIAEDGYPARCILEAARRERADAIVMGSRGLGNVKGALYGSVSHKVCHDAECTCITVTG